MSMVYKTLTDAEYNVLNKISSKTKNDCWFLLKQDKRGTDYIWDLEERKRRCLKTGVGMLCDALDCQENYDSCALEWYEKVTLKNLLDKLKIELYVDWKAPDFHGMHISEFINLYKKARADGEWCRKCGDDYCVNDMIYQFGRDETCFGIVV